MATVYEPPRRRRLYLVRHGDVSYFDETGRPLPPNSVPLNAEGRSQADATAEMFRSVPLDRVLTSDLPRTSETARRILDRLDSPLKSLPIEQRPALREVQPGSLRAITAERQREVFVQALGPRLTRESRFLDGEQIGDFVDRVLACVAELLAEPGWKHLLIVAHGGVNRVILAHALGTGIEGMGLLEQDPCGVNIVDIDDAGHWLIRLVNATAYNPAKIGLEMTTMERIYQEFLRGSANR